MGSTATQLPIDLMTRARISMYTSLQRASTKAELWPEVKPASKLTKDMYLVLQLAEYLQYSMSDESALSWNASKASYLKRTANTVLNKESIWAVSASTCVCVRHSLGCIDKSFHNNLHEAQLWLKEPQPAYLAMVRINCALV